MAESIAFPTGVRRLAARALPRVGPHEERAELTWIHLDHEGAMCDGRALRSEPFPPREASAPTELASSIRLHGILSPLLLRPAGAELEVVCGHRRLLAARMAGATRVPALVRAMTDAEAIRSYLSEKALRELLRPRVEKEALAALRRLRDGRETAPRPVSPPAATPAAAASPLAPAAAPAAGAPAGRGRLAELRDEAEAFFAGVRAGRVIRPEPVERLVDSVLGAVGAGCVIDIGELYRAPVGSAITAPHSLLSALLSARVASHLGWKGKEARALVVAGLLHDVGMVFLEGEGLDAPLGLSAPQREALARHTAIGHALITAAAAWDETVALAARDHHERWQGSGYPAGKQGTEVALPARLLAAVDTFAALVAPRPHRDPLDPRAARLRLCKAAEIGLFDPGLVASLLEALESVPFAAPAPFAPAPLAAPPPRPPVEVPQVSC